MERSKQKNLDDGQEITLKVELKNEQIKSFVCTPAQLKKITLKQLREKLQMPKNFEEYFYFKNDGTEITNELQFVAWDVIQRQRPQPNDVQQPQDNIEEEKGSADSSLIEIESNNVVIKLYMRPFPLKTSYPSKDSYCKDLLKVVELEQYVESLKKLQFFPAEFEFDMAEQRDITKRINLYFYGKQNINDQTILALRIPFSQESGKDKKSMQKLASGMERLIISGKNKKKSYDEDQEESKEEALSNIQGFNPDQENPYYYEAYAKVFKVKFQKHRMQVVADINHRSPMDFAKKQKLPESQPQKYDKKIEYAIIEDTINKNSAKQILDDFNAGSEHVSTNFLRDAIFSCKASRKQQVPKVHEIEVDGLPKTFSKTQREAVALALQERLSIIQGPPGTGKTLVVATIVANWMKQIENPPKVLVCAPSNTAADFIAERLMQIPSLCGKIIRFYPSKREDIFNIKMENVKPYTLLSKFVYMDSATQLSLAQEISPVSPRQQNILHFLNFYFGEFHLNTNAHIQRLITDYNFQGYIELSEIIGEPGPGYGNSWIKRPWGMMAANQATRQDVEQLEQYAETWELNETKVMIRKKTRVVNQQINLLGFDENGLRTMSKEKFERFMEIKAKIESLILSHTPVIITTCKAIQSNALRNFRFTKVIIDEATQANEIETLLTFKEAEQVVLIGDQMQLGPIYKGEAPTFDSMFDRLVKGGYPYFKMLQTQYRMHDFLLKVPNTLFYENLISTGYRNVLPENIFLDQEQPLLFVNHNFNEQHYGSSYVNVKESQMILKLLGLLKQTYDLNKFGFVSPYQGQIQKLKQDLQEMGVRDNVRTIDSWQGREKEFMIFSAVRCNDKGKIGFLENYRRINVALTRAQHGLIIIGNANTLSNDPKWQVLITFFRYSGCFVDGEDEALQKIRDLIDKKNQPNDYDPW